jgi:hypothetical protein
MSRRRRIALVAVFVAIFVLGITNKAHSKPLETVALTVGDNA